MRSTAEDDNEYLHEEAKEYLALCGDLSDKDKHSDGVWIPCPQGKKWTVIGFYEHNGQSVCEHVEANNGIHAFFVAAQKMPSLTMVVALPGHIPKGAGDAVFPGEGVVDAATVLEQPEVFGPLDVE